jgi:acyl-coenzyme A thioesterase PaaI-like protein
LVSARFDPREEYRGAGTSLHGGVAATALDEMLVWAGILDLRVMSVTAKMEVKYRRPVQVTDPILVRARVDERRGRRLLTSGELLVDDRVCVEASGLYLITSDLAEMGIL